MFKKPDKKIKPLIITIAGEPGMGKTTLASTFPKPAFIKTEDGTRSIQGRNFVETDLCNSMNSVIKAFDTAILDSSINTIIVDSISSLEKIVVEEIIAKDGRAKSINQAFGGYGNGQQMVGHAMGELRKKAQQAQIAGKNTVFISHTRIHEVQSVDTINYNKITLQLMKPSLQHFVNEVDMVAFIRLVIDVADDDNDRVGVSTGDREIVCHTTASYDSKNRMGITAPIPFVNDPGVNPLIHKIKEGLGI